MIRLTQKHVGERTAKVVARTSHFHLPAKVGKKDGLQATIGINMAPAV